MEKKDTELLSKKRKLSVDTSVDTSVERTCSYNCSNKAAIVHVVPDPYYGHCYGSRAILLCDTCKPSGMWHDSSHKYDPDVDDYFLGFTDTEPIPCWAYCGATLKCFDCEEDIEAWTKHAYVSLNIINKTKQIYFCTKCYLSYGVNRGSATLQFE